MVVKPLKRTWRTSPVSLLLNLSKHLEVCALHQARQTCGPRATCGPSHASARTPLDLQIQIFHLQQLFHFSGKLPLDIIFLNKNITFCFAKSKIFYFSLIIMVQGFVNGFLFSERLNYYSNYLKVYEVYGYSFFRLTLCIIFCWHTKYNDINATKFILCFNIFSSFCKCLFATCFFGLTVTELLLWHPKRKKTHTHTAWMLWIFCSLLGAVHYVPLVDTHWKACAESSIAVFCTVFWSVGIGISLLLQRVQVKECLVLIIDDISDTWTFVVREMTLEASWDVVCYS